MNAETVHFALTLSGGELGSELNAQPHNISAVEKVEQTQKSICPDSRS